jgi:hypothetical protein
VETRLRQRLRGGPDLRPEAGWVRNLIAAGGCELETAGRHVTLGSPLRLFHDGSRRSLPHLLRPPGRLGGVADFIELSPAGKRAEEEA